MRVLATICLALWLSLAPAHADEVAPSDRVTNGVVIRAEPTTESARLGVLRPGESLEFVEDAPNWFAVRLADGRTGYVIKRWTVRVETAAPAEPPEPAIAAPAARFRMHVIDVGTGLAIFVEGDDFTLVYDGGSNDDRSLGAGNRMWAYLRAVRPDLQSIDYLILSHPHRDHVELLPDLFDAYEIGNVWDSGAINQTCGYRRFLEHVAAESGVTYHNALVDNGMHRARFNSGCGEAAGTVEIAAGSRIDDEPVRLGAQARMTFLHVDGSQHSDPNENSLVVRLDLGATRVLLTGDAEAGGREEPDAAPAAGSIEASLLACCRTELAADILVVGHHGSMTSSREVFLDAVEADDYIISSGPYRYSGVRLPDEEVEAELVSRGTLWSTTHEDEACRVNPAKIGNDDDNRTGGCDNIRVDVDGTGAIVSYWRSAD